MLLAKTCRLGIFFFFWILLGFFQVIYKAPKIGSMYEYLTTNSVLSVSQNWKEIVHRSVSSFKGNDKNEITFEFSNL